MNIRISDIVEIPKMYALTRTFNSSGGDATLIRKFNCWISTNDWHRQASIEKFHVSEDTMDGKLIETTELVVMIENEFTTKGCFIVEIFQLDDERNWNNISFPRGINNDMKKEEFVDAVMAALIEV